MITFRVPGLPIAQPRQRHRIAKTADGKAFSRNYVDGEHPIHAYKFAVKMAAQGVYRNPPLPPGCAVGIQLEFVFPRTKSKTKKRKPNLREPHTSRYDVDNLCKGVFDALKGIVFNDDSQIYVVTATKWIAGDDDLPGVTVSVFWRE